MTSQHPQQNRTVEEVKRAMVQEAADRVIAKYEQKYSQPQPVQPRSLSWINKPKPKRA